MLCFSTDTIAIVEKSTADMEIKHTMADRSIAVFPVKQTGIRNVEVTSQTAFILVSDGHNSLLYCA